MTFPSIFPVSKRKTLSLLTLLIFLQPVIIVCFIFLYYLRPSLSWGKFAEQYNSSPKVWQEPVTSVQQPLLVHENYESHTFNCSYYGTQHGLFHPTVEHARFIITGGAGCIGSHLVKRLRQHYKARQIKVLDNVGEVVCII